MRLTTLFLKISTITLYLGSAIILATFLLLPQGISTPPHAQQAPQPSSSPPPSDWQRVDEMQLQKMQQQMNLTPEQVEKIRAIKAQFRDKINALRTPRIKASQELQTLMASSASREEVREKHRQSFGLVDKFGDLFFEKQLAIREVTTPQQRQQYAQQFIQAQQQNKKPPQQQLEETLNNQKRDDERELQQLQQQLNLTPEQVEKIKAIQAQHRNEYSPLFNIMLKDSDELTIAQSTSASTDELRQQYQQAKGVQQKIFVMSLERELAIRDILTPAQRQQKYINLANLQN
jgi:Spy/CpxP family protein refolding chaperone